MRRLLALVSAIVFLDTAFFAAITPLLPGYVDEFGLSKTGAGILAAAYPAGTFLGAIPGGWFATRAGVRAAVLVGLGLLAVSSAVFAVGDSIVVLDVARFAQGIGSAASWAGALGWLAAEAEPGRRGERLGSAFGFALVGALCGPALGGAADAWSQEAVFLLVAAAAVVLGVWAALEPASPRGTGTSLRELVAGLRDRWIGIGAWIVVLVGLQFGTISVLAPLRLDELGATALLIALTFVLSGVLEAATSPLVGRFADRRGAIVPGLYGLAGAAVAMALLPWPDDRVTLIVLLVLAAPVIGVLWLPAMALLSNGAERRGLEQAVAFAVMNLAWSVGETVGAAGGARLGDAAGDAVPFLLLAGASVVGYLFLLRARWSAPEGARSPAANPPR